MQKPLHHSPCYSPFRPGLPTSPPLLPGATCSLLCAPHRDRQRSLSTEWAGGGNPARQKHLPARHLHPYTRGRRRRPNNKPTGRPEAPSKAVEYNKAGEGQETIPGPAVIRWSGKASSEDIARTQRARWRERTSRGLQGTVSGTAGRAVSQTPPPRRHWSGIAALLVTGLSPREGRGCVSPFWFGHPTPVGQGHRGAQHCPEHWVCREQFIHTHSRPSGVHDQQHRACTERSGNTLPTERA